ncbi:MAG TPA: hypothetical protein VF144_05410 [Chitinophagaceae bacterium]
MVADPTGLLLFLIIAAVPAYYMNKWLLKITRPRVSLGRLILYFLLSVVVAMLYSGVVVYIITLFLPKK